MTGAPPIPTARGRAVGLKKTHVAIFLIVFFLCLTFFHTLLRHKCSRFISAAFVIRVGAFARVRCVYGLVPSEPVWFEPQACVFAMTRVFEHHEFEAVAKKASTAAPEDVLNRFYVPIIGTLKCKYMGTQKSEEKDLIVFNTKVADARGFVK